MKTKMCSIVCLANVHYKTWAKLHNMTMWYLKTSCNYFSRKWKSKVSIWLSALWLTRTNSGWSYCVYNSHPQLHRRLIWRAQAISCGYIRSQHRPPTSCPHPHSNIWSRSTYRLYNSCTVYNTTNQLASESFWHLEPCDVHSIYINNDVFLTLTAEIKNHRIELYMIPITEDSYSVEHHSLSRELRLMSTNPCHRNGFKMCF